MNWRLRREMKKNLRISEHRRRLLIASLAVNFCLVGYLLVYH